MNHRWLPPLLALPVLAASVALAAEARAETVRLRTGETLIGDVALADDDVVVDVRYPTTNTLRLRRADLAPESLYEVLERRTNTKDAAAHKALGETAESLGLHAAALTEYRRVLALDRGSTDEMKVRVARLEERIAADLLQDGKDLLEAGHPNAALVRLHVILEQHASTPAASAAKGMLDAAHRAAGAAAEVARTTVPASDVAKTAQAVEADLASGDAARRKVSGHAGARGMADLRAIRGAIDAYEDAWRGARRLPVATGSTAGPDPWIGALRTRSRKSLVQAYLDAGTILIQRRAILAAERYCDKACELDPEHRTSHELHRLVLEAQATSWRGRAPAR